MNTDKEVTLFYTEHYQKLIKFLMNKAGGGNKQWLKRYDAEEVLHNTFIYHFNTPAAFNSKYVYNKLSQMRYNFLRDRVTYNKFKWESLHQEPTVEEVEYVDEEMSTIIRGEIDGIKNDKHREILYSHILNGNKLGEDKGNERAVVTRFRKYMVEKYGEEE